MRIGLQLELGAPFKHQAPNHLQSGLRAPVEKRRSLFATVKNIDSPRELAYCPATLTTFQAGPA
ncbi:MAG: hypothetical protein H0T92_14970 [Pyrinomonadaceae bacterium]|nr:hypothetical protein [Pyrinomonadaceae bacterium]